MQVFFINLAFLVKQKRTDLQARFCSKFVSLLYFALY